MDGKKILGINADTFYALLFVIVLVILGIVSFHYYIYVSSGNGAALKAGTGVGFTLFPDARHPGQRDRDSLPRQEGWQ